MRGWNKRYNYDVERYHIYRRGWDSGLGALFARDCSYAYAKDLKRVMVNLPYRVETMIYRLAREVEGEWLAYCLGTKGEDGDGDGYVYTIDGLYLPEQEVGLDRVEVIEAHLPEDRPIIGTVHSHGQLPAFLSSWDRDFVSSNHDLSLIVGRRGQEWLAVARVELPCGMLHLVEAEIDFERPGVNLQGELERIKVKVGGIPATKAGKLGKRYGYRSWYRHWHSEEGLGSW